MNNNLGAAHRIMRAVGAVPLTACAIAAPYPLALRLCAFAVPALYLAATAILGSCACKSLMGRLRSS